MTNNKYNLVCIGGVFLASFIAGWIIVFAAGIYNKYSSLQEEKLSASLTSFGRAMVIQSIDFDNRTILASILRSRGIYDRIQVLVPKEAKIERQTPQIENGVIVGFSPLSPANFDELTPSMRAYINVNTDDEGRLIAQAILIGDPFPRP